MSNPDHPASESSRRDALRGDLRAAAMSAAFATFCSFIIWLLAQLGLFDDSEMAVTMWPVYFALTFLQVPLFDGRRPRPLRRLGGKDAVGEFMRACRSGRAPRGVDRDLWLSVLARADDGRTYQRRLRFMLVALGACVMASVGVGAAAAASSDIGGPVVGLALVTTLTLGVSIGFVHAFVRTKYKTVELRRDLERSA